MPRRTLNRKNIYDLSIQKCQMPSINLFIDTFGHRLLYEYFFSLNADASAGAGCQCFTSIFSTLFMCTISLFAKPLIRGHSLYYSWSSSISCLLSFNVCWNTRKIYKYTNACHINSHSRQASMRYLIRTKNFKLHIDF